MACAGCGAELPEAARFCASCGASARAEAPKEADPVLAPLERALARQYHFVRLLGRGGMGAVYLARETALDRAVAIKVLPPETGRDTESRNRFRREARTAAKLSHPNIVPLLSFGEAEGTLYYVMGYVRGEPLSARMRREGGLPTEDVRRLLAELAGALDYAHRHGVVHRDVKPDNVLLDDEAGRAMLADFGIAKARGGGQTLTAAGSVLGTPAYMSPEQASGKGALDGGSDLYSLGVLGYAMLAGRPPFEGQTADVLAQHLTKEARPLKALVPDVPDDLASAVTRCLAKHPSQRWPDGRTLQAALAADGSDAEPPEALGDLTRAGRVALGGLAFALAYTLIALLWSRLETTTALVWLVVLLLAVACLHQARKARVTGHSWPEVRRHLFAKPRWLSGWWPSPLRPAGDVWQRLPPDLRRFRIALSMAVPLGLGLMVSILLLNSPRYHRALEHGHATLGAWRLGMLFFDYGLFADLIACGWYGRRAWRSARAQGFHRRACEKLLFEPTHGHFWRRPEVAALLRPEPGRAAPKTPHELLRAIAAAAESLTGPARQAGVEALAAARQLVTTLEALEAEENRLRADADSNEVARIEARLEGLGTEVGTEDAPRKQMRNLLRQQLELLLGVLARVEELAARRGRLVARLEGLWRELPGATTPEKSDRVLTLAHEAALEARTLPALPPLATLTQPQTRQP